MNIENPYVGCFDQNIETARERKQAKVIEDLSKIYNDNLIRYIYQLPPKSDIFTMELPFFALKDTQEDYVWESEDGKRSLQIKPGSDNSRPTVFDREILIFCMTLVLKRLDSIQLNALRDV